MRLATVAAVLALFAAMASATAAEPMAFAAAQAPEQGFFTCHAATAESAAGCALKKCTDSNASECAVMVACATGWAGTMGVMLEEVHFTDTVCGAPSKQAAIQALVAFCRGRLPHVRECFISEVWSPEGQSEKVERTITKEQLTKKKS
ncbi:MAG: hypothetical protein R3D57_10255 [Hyphomicrobiaceae bacterium]